MERTDSDVLPAPGRIGGLDTVSGNDVRWMTAIPLDDYPVRLEPSQGTDPTRSVVAVLGRRRSQGRE
jgi:hypothetical protein